LFLSSSSRPGVVSSAFPQLSLRSNMGTEAEADLTVDTRNSIDLTSPDIEPTPVSAHALLDNSQADSPTFEKPPYNSLPPTTTNSASDQGASSISETIPGFASACNNSAKTSIALTTQRGLNRVHPYSVDCFRHEDTIVSGKEATTYSCNSLDSALSKSGFDFSGDSKGNVPNLDDPVRMHTLHSRHASQPLDNSEVFLHTSLDHKHVS
jgi:hypothetical protein